MNTITRRHLLAAAPVVAAPAVLATAPAVAAPAPAFSPPPLDSRFLFAPGAYAARGTVFTRDISKMPVLPESAQMAQRLRDLHRSYVPDQWKGRLILSANTWAYNIPIHVVDSSSTSQNFELFWSDDARVIYQLEKTKEIMGAEKAARIPLPKGFQIPGGGDMSIAVYDVATGLWREYFHVTMTDSGPYAGQWRYSSGGYIQLTPGELDFASATSLDKWGAQRLRPDGKVARGAMQLTGGTSSVVGLANTLTQIGIAEVEAGRIAHAVSLTLPNGRGAIGGKPNYSWPATQGDGNLEDPLAVLEGQAMRLPPSLDIDSLGLRPMTKLVAKAVQEFGAYGADRNFWCVAANFEYDTSVPVGKHDEGFWGAGLREMWGPGDHLNLNDFPMHLLEFAPADWAGMDQAPKPVDPAFVDVPRSRMFFEEIQGVFQLGITTGWPDGTYRPNLEVARDAMAAFLFRLVGDEGFRAPSGSPFRDVAPGTMFFREMAWLHDSGISTGWPDGTFRPGLSIGRDAMAAFLHRADGSPRLQSPTGKVFRDVPASLPFAAEIEWAAREGLVTGWPDGTFRPLSPIRRDAMAALLWRFSKRR